MAPAAAPVASIETRCRAGARPLKKTRPSLSVTAAWSAMRTSAPDDADGRFRVHDAPFGAARGVRRPDREPERRAVLEIDGPSR